MKYNPVNHTITRNNGTPCLRLDHSIGAPEAYQIADTLLHAPEWGKEKKELEFRVSELEDELEEEEKMHQAAQDDAGAAEARAERLETELTQARLRIEELEAMLASCEAALKTPNP